ncbi:hypothetical protein QBC36DRAFT_341456 [Triangularia setosa]|uniref:Cip1-like core domain-containing protein n=1 Tax=Triangularia setosa TaxID=2587417 RepID=A0AAN6VWG2_9PEZI|nr:hypothetical protein QBC36DRAFT_341456 [Podospora setosa]
MMFAGRCGVDVMMDGVAKSGSLADMTAALFHEEPTYALDCSQDGRVTLDTSNVHSGKNPMRVDGGKVREDYCRQSFTS